MARPANKKSLTASEAYSSRRDSIKEDKTSKEVGVNSKEVSSMEAKASKEAGVNSKEVSKEVGINREAKASKEVGTNREVSKVKDGASKVKGGDETQI